MSKSNSLTCLCNTEMGKLMIKRKENYSVSSKKSLEQIQRTMQTNGTPAGREEEIHKNSKDEMKRFDANKLCTCIIRTYKIIKKRKKRFFLDIFFEI